MTVRHLSELKRKARKAAKRADGLTSKDRESWVQRVERLLAEHKKLADLAKQEKRPGSNYGRSERFTQRAVAHVMGVHSVHKSCLL